MVVVAISLALTGALWVATAKLTPAHPWFSFPADHHIYRFMAMHGPGEFHIAPWGWRILGPFAAAIIPGSVQIGFQLVTFSSLAITGFLTWLICRNLRFRPTLSLVGVLLFFSLSWAVKFNIFDFWLTDPLSFAFVAAGVYFAITRRPLPFAVCLAVGVLAKESVIFVAPLYYSLNTTRLVDGQLLRKTVLAVLPAVLLLVALRLAIPAHNGDAGYTSTLPPPVAANARTVPDYSPVPLVIRTVEARADDWPETPIGAISAFGLVAGLLALVGAIQRRSWLLRFSPFLILVAGQLLFAQNTERLLVLGFPAIIPLALAGSESLLARRLMLPSQLVVLVIGVFCLQLVVKTEMSPSAVAQAGSVGIVLLLRPIAHALHTRRASCPCL